MAKGLVAIRVPLEVIVEGQELESRIPGRQGRGRQGRRVPSVRPPGGCPYCIRARDGR